MPTDTDVISPVKLAKELGIRPQKIYNLLRQGKVTGVKGDKSQEVYRSEVLRYLQAAPTGRGRPSNKASKARATGKAREAGVGSVVSWSPGKGKKKFGVITAWDADPDVDEGALVDIKIVKAQEDEFDFVLPALRFVEGLNNGRYQIEDTIALVREAYKGFIDGGENLKAMQLFALLEEWGSLGDVHG